MTPSLASHLPLYHLLATAHRACARVLAFSMGTWALCTLLISVSSEPDRGPCMGVGQCCG